MTTRRAATAMVQEGFILIIAAWIGMLLASSLPAIIWHDVCSGDLTRTRALHIEVLLLLAALTFVWNSIALLRRYFILLVLLFAADEVVRPVVAGNTFWQQWFGTDHNAWLLTAVLFALGHFYGMPAGPPGILLSVFAGWILGKSMVETGGFLLSWIIQFLLSIIVFMVAFIIATG